MKNKFKQYIMSEISELLKNPFPVIIAFVLPIVAWIILALTFKNGYVNDLPICVLDNDNSCLSRKIIRDLDATQALQIKYQVNDMEEAENLMKKSECYFIISFEKDFSKKIKNGASSSINIIENGFYLMYAKVGYKVIAQTLVENSNNIQVNRLVNAGLGLNEATQRAIPIKTDIYSYGNPYFNYTIYLIPGILISILQMSASFSALWIFRKSFSETRIIPQIGERLSFVFGKTLPLFSINIITLIVLFSIFLPLSGIIISSNYFILFLNGIILIIVSFGMGAILSLLLENLVTASQALLVINAPAFVFSGYTFPRWAMPEIIQNFAEIIPVTKFLDFYFPIIIFNHINWNYFSFLIIEAIIIWALIALSLSNIGIKVLSKVKIINSNIFSIKA